ncbi:MAG: DEAD/DEAH box helicase [Armatimonadetes bacterium]|nr:DEAD/DEAH box helicase [Armatimonadota bacterium]
MKGKRQRRKRKGETFSLKVATKEFLEGLGEAEPEPFQPSPFQEQALSAVLKGDTIVVAPTGSGKTWIAERAIDRLLQQGGKSWYTTPLKALSNQKYDSFRDLFGLERVGLLTGERKENPQAPVIVATTEILRNVLYSGLEPCDLIVLDEAHYIADPERGVTWEEVIILSPPESRLLLLSATVSNASELAAWMEEVRGKKPYLIQVSRQERPVPLRYGIMDRHGRPLPLEQVVNRNWKTVKSLLWDRFDPPKLVGYLGERNLLPAIVFLPRRRDCDEAVRRFYRLTDEKGLEQREKVLAELAGRIPRLRDHPMLPFLWKAGVAAHHAGHLTGWKLAVEKLLRMGLVRAVFATTTLAAGLDVPARTVVLPSLQTRDEEGKRTLTALEFHQMTGRAGRRGMDKVGFVLLVPRRPQDLQVFADLTHSPPEALKSAFRTQYYQVLNLVSAYGFERALNLIDKSLAVYQRASRSQKRAQAVRRQLRDEFAKRAQVLRTLAYLTDDYRLTEQGKWAAMIRHEMSLVIAEAVRAGVLANLSPEELAGWCAALTSERVPRYPVGRLELKPLEEIATFLEMVENQHRLPSSGFLRTFEGGVHSAANRKASVVARWVEGKMAWRSLVMRTSSDEGDIQRLILQAAEILSQLEDLPSHLSHLARIARSKALREPVADFVLPSQPAEEAGTPEATPTDYEDWGYEITPF